jgi:four helix bundle protein
MYNFKQLKVWQKGFAIAVQAFKLTETFPKEQKFSLTQQITRASVSIPSNIAEGSSRSSAKDYSRFLELSLGSSYELETQLLIAEAVQFGDHNIRAQMLQDLTEEQKMLLALMHTLNR